MTFEIKNLFDYILNNQEDNYVLATVVLLDGSSYRKPGVRMIISSSNKTYGNISGGCVEKDIIIKSKKVFLFRAARTPEKTPINKAIKIA